ncbi:MAG: hypothetical protein LBR76_05140 [Oscillospiraceae bacterium]|jgi:hypothetical protein|nr:hypothetical protein [Oscillospiraceae bacterium]
MPVTVTKVEQYEGFGACVHVTNGLIELFATTDRGPRIIHLSLCGGENLFWTDTKSEAVIPVQGLDLAFGKGDTYHILGGHRLWSSPEHVLNSYYPDTDPVEVTVTPQGCVLTPPPQQGTCLQLVMEVRMDPERERVSVRHRIQNTGGGVVTLAPWAITQLAPGGLEVFPQSKQDIALLPDRVFVIWPYTDMGDRRLTWNDGFVAIRPDGTDRPMKIGTLNRAGYALYHNKGVVFKKMWNALPGAEYPDFGCNFETYTNRHFIEIESLAPLSTLYDGQSATHEEEWFCCREPQTLDEQALLDKYGN